jgi:hypothetical protein
MQKNTSSLPPTSGGGGGSQDPNATPSGAKHQRNASGQAMTGAGSNVKPLLPFDLNNLINLTHSFELLKDTLEYLATNS